MRRLVTTYSTLDWSADGALVTKVRPAAFDARRRFRDELRINRLLVERPPPVPTVPLVGHDVRHRRLTFEAAPGEPLGPKYPHELPAGALDTIAALAGALDGYRPRRQWFRRVDPVRRLLLARRGGLVDDGHLHDLLPLAHRLRGRLRFAHGDLTARNVLGGHAGVGPTLIDWEWAGLHPPGYDLAFLWYSLVELPTPGPGSSVTPSPHRASTSRRSCRARCSSSSGTSTGTCRRRTAPSTSPPATTSSPASPKPSAPACRPR